MNTLKNKVASRSFKEKKRTASIEHETTDQDVSRPEPVDATTPSPREELTNKERRAVIEKAIATLDDVQRELIRKGVTPILKRAYEGIEKELVDFPKWNAKM